MDTALSLVEPTADVLAPFHAGGTRALIDRWLAFLAEQVALGQLSPGTVSTYGRNIRRWVDYLESIARTDQPTGTTIGAYVAALRVGRKPAAVNALLATARSLYGWAESQDLYPEIGRSVKPLRVAKDEPLPALTQDQVAALVSAIPGHDLCALRDRALVCTLFATAARCCSLERANVSDLDLEAGTLRHQAKGALSKDALARLTPVAVAALRVYLAARSPDSTAPLFAPVGNRRSHDGRLTTRSMRAIVLRFMERSGHAQRRDGRLSQPGAFSAHCLRRSALTAAYESEGGIEAAQVLAGHASADTTRRSYVRVAKGRQLQRLATVLDMPLSVLSGSSAICP